MIPGPPPEQRANLRGLSPSDMAQEVMRRASSRASLRSSGTSRATPWHRARRCDARASLGSSLPSAASAGAPGACSRERSAPSRTSRSCRPLSARSTLQRIDVFGEDPHGRAGKLSINTGSRYGGSISTLRCFTFGDRRLMKPPQQKRMRALLVYLIQKGNPPNIVRFFILRTGCAETPAARAYFGCGCVHRGLPRTANARERFRLQRSRLEA